MKIHSDVIGRLSLYEATSVASRTADGRAFVEIEQGGSRSRNNAFNVKLSGDGTANKRRVNPGTARGVDRSNLDYAATWSQWGWFLAALYRVDPLMVCPNYADATAFHAATRFAFTGTPVVVTRPDSR